MGSESIQECHNCNFRKPNTIYVITSTCISLTCIFNLLPVYIYSKLEVLPVIKCYVNKLGLTVKLTGKLQHLGPEDSILTTRIWSLKHSSSILIDTPRFSEGDRLLPQMKLSCSEREQINGSVRVLWLQSTETCSG